MTHLSFTKKQPNPTFLLASGLALVVACSGIESEPGTGADGGSQNDGGTQGDGGTHEGSGYDVSFGQSAYFIDTPPGMPLQIAATGTSTTVLLPFEFEFFGEALPVGTPLHVSSSGLVALEEAPIEGDNNEWPRPDTKNGLIAAFWDDFEYPTGRVYAHVTPETLIISWFGAKSRTTEATMEIQLLLLAAHNLIEIRTFSVEGTDGLSGTVGLQGPGGQRFPALSCTPNCQQSDVPTGSVVLFRPANKPIAGFDLAFSTKMVTLPEVFEQGKPINLDVTVTNKGTIESGAGPLGGTARLILSKTESFAIDASNGLLPITASANLPDIQPSSTAELNLFGTIRVEPGRYHAALWIQEDDTEIDRSNNLLRLGAVDVIAPRVIKITTTSLDSGLVSEPYSVQLEHTGASEPSFFTHSPLPSGFSLFPSGRLEGTPTEPFEGQLTITATQAEHEPDTVVLALSVKEDTLGGHGYELDVQRTVNRTPRAFGPGLSIGSRDTMAPVALPFDFPFFGETIPMGTEINVTSNGTIYLGEGTVDSSNTLLPRASAPYGVIAGFWDRYIRSFDDTHLTMGPESILLTWSSAVAAQDTKGTATYTVSLFSNGIIEMRMHTITSPGLAATVGIGDPSGQRAVQLSCSPNCDADSVPRGSIITFRPTGAERQGPDLVVTLLDEVPRTISSSDSLALKFRVTNVGNAPYFGHFGVHLFAGDTPYFPVFPPIRDPTAGTQLASAGNPQDERNLAAGAVFEGTMIMDSVPKERQTAHLGLWIEPFEHDANLGNNYLPLGMVEIVD